MSAASILRESFAPLIDLVFPPRCPLCGEAIGEPTGLCSACWSTLLIPSGPSCCRCQRPLPELNEPGPAECPACMAQPPRHDGIAAATFYNEPSRKLVLAFKHGGKTTLAPLMARMIVARLPDLEGEWIIAPVPLHRWRLWRRGYNQAAVLAQAIAKLTGRPLLVDALVRTRATPVLGDLGRKERRKALAGAIRVRPSCLPRIGGHHVLLVDDVMTSGATTDACVRALKRARAGKVVIACFARVLEEADRAGIGPHGETPGA